MTGSDRETIIRFAVAQRARLIGVCLAVTLSSPVGAAAVPMVQPLQLVRLASGDTLRLTAGIVRASNAAVASSWAVVCIP